MDASDYALKTPEERIQRINEILETTPSRNLTPQYLNAMSDYILFVSENNQTKKEKASEHPIITKNRTATIQKRESSFEGIISSLENGEDGLYTMITNDKNQIMDHKDPINEEDKEAIPQLQEYFNQIEQLQQKFKTAKGYNRFLIKKQIKEVWQQMYILKESMRQAPIKGRTSNQIKTFAHMPLEDKI